MSYRIISKFIKDISFEIPNVQAFVLLEKELPNYGSLNKEEIIENLINAGLGDDDEVKRFFNDRKTAVTKSISINMCI